MFNNEQKLFLGLSSKEYLIIKSLEENQKSIFTLSRDIKIPRATLYPIIIKLYERGYIKVSKHGMRFIYQTRSSQELKNKLFDIAHSLEPKTVAEVKIIYPAELLLLIDLLVKDKRLVKMLN